MTSPDNRSSADEHHFVDPEFHDPQKVSDLVERIRGGDKKSFSDLFALYQPRLWRLITFRLHPMLQRRIDADDVMQDAWVRSAERLDHFLTDGTEAPFLWFRTVAMQTLVDLHRFHLGTRKRSAMREYSINKGWSGDSTCSSLAYGLHRSRQATPSSSVRRMEDAKQLDQALSGMNEIDREVLALRHFEELSNTETAKVLNMSEQAASARYVRALARLKQVLEAFNRSAAKPSPKTARKKPPQGP